MDLFILAVAALYGLLIGSFLNVCIYRIPAEKSIVWPPSSCPKCNNRIKWYDNIPVFSFVFLLGKCRVCKNKISLRYPLIELFTAAVTVLFVWRFGLEMWTLVSLVAVYCLIVLSVIDYDSMIIPDRFSLGLIVWGLLFFWTNPYFTGTMGHMLWQSFLGACVGFFGLWALAAFGTLVFGKEAMGGGDIKLMGGVGALLGWEGVVSTLVIASFFGVIYSVILLLQKKVSRKSEIPFGPFLSMGAAVNLFYLITPQMVMIWMY